mgnify:CR=1 FL=1
MDCPDLSGVSSTSGVVAAGVGGGVDHGQQVQGGGGIGGGAQAVKIGEGVG